MKQHELGVIYAAQDLTLGLQYDIETHVFSCNSDFPQMVHSWDSALFVGESFYSVFRMVGRCLLGANQCSTLVSCRCLEVTDSTCDEMAFISDGVKEV